MVSTRDSSKHLENVHAKLGVHTRTAAAALIGTIASFSNPDARLQWRLSSQPPANAAPPHPASSADAESRKRRVAILAPACGSRHDRELPPRARARARPLRSRRRRRSLAERIARARTLLTEAARTRHRAGRGRLVTRWSSSLGDGGINEVLNGAPPGVPLGFLPGGGERARAGARLAAPPGGGGSAGRRSARVWTHPHDLRGPRERPALRAFRGHRLDAELVRAWTHLAAGMTATRPGDTAFVKSAVRLVAEHWLRSSRCSRSRAVAGPPSPLVANADQRTRAPAADPDLRRARGALRARFLDLVAPKPCGARRHLPGGCRATS